MRVLTDRRSPLSSTLAGCLIVALSGYVTWYGFLEGDHMDSELAVSAQTSGILHTHKARTLLKGRKQ